MVTCEIIPHILNVKFLFLLGHSAPRCHHHSPPHPPHLHPVSVVSVCRPHTLFVLIMRFVPIMRVSLATIRSSTPTCFSLFGSSYDIILSFINIFRFLIDFRRIWERFWEVCGRVFGRFGISSKSLFYSSKATVFKDLALNALRKQRQEK